MKKIILSAIAIIMSGVLVTTTLSVMVFTVIGNNENIGEFTSNGLVEEFEITGTQDNNDFNLTFTSENWELADINLKLDKKKGIATAIVPMSTASGAAQAAIDWATKIANDNSYTYGHGSFKCCICNNMRIKQFTCMPFLAAAYAHGTNDPYLMKNGKHVMNLNENNFKGKLKDYWTKVGLCSELEFSDLQPGDVLIKWSKNNNSGHAWMYGGDDKVIEAVPSDIHVVDGAKRKFESYKNGESKCGMGHKNYVMRYKGPGANTSVSTSVSLGGVSHSASDVTEGACRWAEAIAADETFHKGKGSTAKKSGCYFCGTNKNKSDEILNKEKTYSSNAFVTAAFAHGGGEPTMLRWCKSGGSYIQGVSTRRTSFYGSRLFKNMGKIGQSELKRGDVLCNSSSVWIYLGSGKCAKAGKNDNNKADSKKWKNSIRVFNGYGNYTEVYRYIGSGGGDMEIPNGNTMTTYTKKSAGTILETIKTDTGSRKKLVHGSTYDVAQSFAAVSGGYAVALVDHNSAGPGEIRFYDSSVGYKSKTAATIYHANGSCGTSDGGMICAGTLISSGKRGMKFSFSNGVPKREQVLTLPAESSSIAYDKDTSVYVCATGRTMRVYSADMKTLRRTINRNMHGAYYQDIGAGGGYIFACHTKVKGGENNGENYIDVYSETTGDFCGSYKMNYGELESVEIVNGELVLLVHIKGTETNYIQFTGIGGNAGGRAELTINYAKQKGGKIIFRGTLNGGSILGEFTQNENKKGKIGKGKGYYGGGAISSSGGAGNPFKDKKFFVTGLACAYESGHSQAMHYGWDLQCTSDYDAPIYAVTDGDVYLSGSYGNFGKHCVIIQKGDMYVIYGHMAKATVQKGDHVTQGQQVGIQGGYGASGPTTYAKHLHLEFRKGSMSQSSAIKNTAAVRPVFQMYSSNWGEIKDVLDSLYSPLTY